MKIALAFSGGGYRASAFNLGTLTYLSEVRMDDGPLLRHVVALSTVSGGTITGARYAVGLKRGETVEEVFRALYAFFLNADLITDSIRHLSSDKDWNKKRVKSLINSFADLYDVFLFHREKFGLLLDGDKPIHLKHISFNATEFTTGLQFRFQVSEQIRSTPKGAPGKGLIGNYYNNLPEEIARHVRMADILAASSCFPGGFEPINFPQDFVLPELNEIRNYMQDSKFPIGLMDGGIVDNQGIEPLLLAEERMKLNDPDCKDCVLDLIIVSDVSSPYMEKFTASVQEPEKGWRKLTLCHVRMYAIGACAFSVAALVGGILCSSMLTAVLSTVVLTLSALVCLLIAAFHKALRDVDLIDTRKLKKLSHVKLLVFESFLKNRVMSVMKLTGSVFMKHIRRLNFRSIYDHEEWKNRRITNAIYELRPGEKTMADKLASGRLPEYMKPSPAIGETSALAASMPTTLWFKEGEEGSRMLDAVLACGQYTVCWNLLEYIQKLKKDASNTNKEHQRLVACETQIKEDWLHFCKDPYWMVRELKG